jgi:hypothetical protein
MLTVPKGYSQIKATFGNPEKHGELNAAWVKASLTQVDLPFTMRNAYKPTQSITHATVHILIAHEFIFALTDIWNYARVEVKKIHGTDESTEFYDNRCHDYLADLGLDLFGGTFVYRKKRGSLELSMHSFGIAFDLNPGENQMGTDGNMPQWAINIFKKWGFSWGGLWKGHGKDPMHFQYATGA